MTHIKYQQTSKIGETKTHSSTRKDKSNFSNIKGGK